MIYSIRGTLTSKGTNFSVVEVGGIGFKIVSSSRTLARLSEVGGTVSLFCFLHVREDALELYGFRTPEELRFFELLNSVSGVGPKSALAVLDVAELAQLAAAIQEGRPDLLTRASGIGRKTAERIILELKSKIQARGTGVVVERMERDAELLDALAGIGYRREEARVALEKVDAKVVSLEDRLKEALKILGKKGR